MLGTLTDCMQEKKRAGRFSPKNTTSEVETDEQTDNTGQKGTVNREADTESEARTAGAEGRPEGWAGRGAAGDRPGLQDPLRGEEVIRGGMGGV